MSFDTKETLAVVVTFLLVYCATPVLLGVGGIKIARWLGFSPLARTTSRILIQRVTMTLTALGVVTFLGLRLGTEVGYPAVLIGAAPFLMTALLLAACLMVTTADSPTAEPLIHAD